MDNHKPTNSSFFEKLREEVQTAPLHNPNTHKGSSGAIFGIVGLVLLVIGIGTGVVLVQQNQNIKSKAALPPGCSVSYSGSGTNGPTSFTLSGSCPGQIVTYSGASCPTTSNEVSRSGSGAGTYSANPAGGCQQVDYQPQNDPSQGIGVCTCGTGSSSTPPPSKKNCGESCTSDSQCQQSNANALCVSGKCANKNCPTNTMDGANCSCFGANIHDCGDPCGISSGSCINGTVCGFINVSNRNRCQQYETKSGEEQSPNQFCIPKNPQNGYQLVSQCTDMQVNNLIKPDGSATGLNRRDILAACGVSTPPPGSSPSPSGSPTGTGGQCGDILTVNDQTFAPFSNSSPDFTTVIYRAPTIPGAQIIGVEATFDDGFDSYEYLPLVTTNDGNTFTRLDHTCKDKLNGWVDVCTPPTNRIHSLTLSNYQQTPDVSLTTIQFHFKERASSNKINFTALKWKYRMLCSSPTPPTTTIRAQCLSVAVYDTNWDRLSTNDIQTLQSGDTIRLAVSGDTTGGSIDKARFRVNGDLKPDTSQRRADTGEFYLEYTIPANIKSFSVNAQLHHSSLGWY